MGIVMTTSMNDIDDFFEQEIEKRIQALIFGLNHIGATVVNEAKTNKGYTTRTGALISSTGYRVIRDGAIVGGPGFSGLGASAGEVEMNRLIALYPTGVFLIVVAGMNYASAVEGRNLNVLASAELLSDQLVPDLMKQLGFIK